VRCLPCQVGLSSRWLPTNNSSAYAPALALTRAIFEPAPKIGGTIALSSRQRDESHHPRLHVDIARDGSVRQVAVERDAVRKVERCNLPSNQSEVSVQISHAFKEEEEEEEVVVEVQLSMVEGLGFRV